MKTRNTIFTTERLHLAWLLAAAVIALAVVFAAGCGNGSTSTTGTAGETSSTTTQGVSTSGAGGGATVQVTMKNRAFAPETLTVNAGDTVVWTNEDPVQHDVIADNGQFKSELFGQGQTFSFTFSDPGTYPYHCSVHPGMVGTVIVQ